MKSGHKVHQLSRLKKWNEEIQDVRIPLEGQKCRVLPPPFVGYREPFSFPALVYSRAVGYDQPTVLTCAC